jgi:hypothetical protein
VRLVRASEWIQRAMPSASLNWVRLDQQLVLDGARQRWIGLPEGALSKPRLKNLTCLSETFRSFEHTHVVTTPTLASPCAGFVRHLSPRRRSSLDQLARHDRRDLRTTERWSASCRRAITGIIAYRNHPKSNFAPSTIRIPAGCYGSGVSKKSIPRVALN